MSNTSISRKAERDEFLAHFDAQEQAAKAVDCGYPNCQREGHESVTDPGSWTHEIYLDAPYDGDLFFVIYLRPGGYELYTQIDCTAELATAEDITRMNEMMTEAARLVTLYGERIAALEAGERPERDTLNHWMAKDAILTSLVDGAESTALCGEKFVPKSFGGGHTSTNASVCAMCQHVYNGLTD